LPSLRDLAQLRALLPYAAKLLPLLTGQAAPAAAPAELGALHRHLGEVQTEGRSLRSEVAGQSEQLNQLATRLDTRLDQLAATLTARAEQIQAEQASLASRLRRLSTLVTVLGAATLLLLIALIVMGALLLARAA
jgi:cell division protein ZapA (FtsZ GTPase activity inhibitor)